MAKVLIVDDTTPARTLLSRLLREDGFETEMAADGSEAVKKVEASPPDLIVLDLQMPEMDGLAVLQWLRNHPQFGAVAVIILSAAGEEEMERAAALGARACLTKAKATWRQIQHEIRELTGQRHAVKLQPG